MYQTTNIAVIVFIKNWLKGGEKRDTYLTHVCRLLWGVEQLENTGVFTNTVAFILFFYSQWNPQCRLKVCIFSSFFPQAVWDTGQVGIAPFPSNFFCHFTFPGFPITLSSHIQNVIPIKFYLDSLQIVMLPLYCKLIKTL